MVDPEVFARRLATLERLLADLRGLAQVDRQAFLQSRGYQAQAERWLHLAAECAIDLANHLVADRGWRTPGTYREAFEVLHEAGVVDSELAAQMASWAGLRNLLVHVYLEVDHERLHDILTRELGQLEAFALAMNRALADG